MQTTNYPKINTLIFYTIACTLSLFATTARAMRVTPVIFDMTTTGAASKKIVSVTSNGTNPLPVELIVFPIDLDSNGKPIKLTGNEDDLMIFPPQAVIPPGKTQTFRVQWVGDPELPQSRSYSISINQVPVQIDMPDAQPDKVHTAVQVVLNFSIFATVQPTMGSAELKVRKVELEESADSTIEPVPIAKKSKKKGKGKKIAPQPTKPAKVLLTIENSGNIHNYLLNAKLTLQADNWSKTYLPEQIIQMLGPGIVLPKHTRRFTLNIEDLPVNPGRLSATIDMGNRTGLPY